MQRMATQTIVTTHSPMIASVPDPNQLILLVNNGGDLSAEPLLQEPLDQAVTNVRRALFLADRTATVSAVMHPAILIPEEANASWLRLLARVADLTETDADVDRSAFTHDVGVIPTKDARVVAKTQNSPEPIQQSPALWMVMPPVKPTLQTSR